MTEQEAQAILGRTITFETTSTPGVVQEGVAEQVFNEHLMLRGEGSSGIPISKIVNVTVVETAEPNAGSADHALSDDTESGAPR